MPLCTAPFLPVGSSLRGRYGSDATTPRWQVPSSTTRDARPAALPAAPTLSLLGHWTMGMPVSASLGSLFAYSSSSS